MTNDDLYQIILQFLRKDRRGGVLSELEYDKELQRMNISYMDTVLPRYEVEQNITDKLEVFKEVIDGVSLTMSGVNITIPSDYIRHEYLMYKQDGTTERDFDVLTGGQWSSRLGSSVSPPSERFPVCRYRGGFIETRPAGLTKNYLEYGYLRYPITPHYDGYFDANGNFNYLGVGASHALLADEVGLDGQTTGTYNSSTIELEWHDDDKWIIGDMIIRRMGIVLTEPLVTQFNDQITREKK